MHETTLDRDVRLSPDDIKVLQGAVRYRMKQVQRSIATAEKNKATGGTIQHGTLDRHYDERRDLMQTWDKLEAARKAIARRLADIIEAGRG